MTPELNASVEEGHEKRLKAWKIQAVCFNGLVSQEKVIIPQTMKANGEW